MLSEALEWERLALLRMKSAPIALFVYKRAAHARQALAALQQADLAAESALYVFSDGPKGPAEEALVAEVRNSLEGLQGFKSVEVIRRPANWGLAKSIIDGVTEICCQHGRVIVVEDDLVTSPHFLRYMNEGLALYQNCPEVASIHGYVYPVKGPLPETFFLKGADCWGWATWQRAWELFNPDGKSLLEELERRNLTTQFDFNGSFGYTEMLRQQIDGANDSWAIRWYASAFLRDKLTLYPGRSLVRNVGLDASGTHCGQSDSFRVRLAERPVKVESQPLEENPRARGAFEAYFRRQRHPSFFRELRVRLRWGKAA
jgi:hypothetical protein